MKEKRDWLLISTIVGYTVVAIALIVMVAPFSDSFLNGIRGFLSTFEWLAKHLTGG